MTHIERAAYAVVLGGLGVAVTAMTALHGFQPALDVIEEPISYFVHGHHGWLLPLALGAFGIACIALSLALGRTVSTRSARSLAGFGFGMLLAAILPSDRWFPWELEPSISGLIHAIIAVISPVVLLDAMMSSIRSGHAHRRATRGWLVVAYAGALLASGISLAVGFWHDRSPPRIGAAERLLALTATAWVALTAAELWSRKATRDPSTGKR